MRRLCAIAGVSRCGYYKYLQSNSGKDVEDKKINSLIVEIQEKYHFSVEVSPKGDQDAFKSVSKMASGFSISVNLKGHHIRGL